MRASTAWGEDNLNQYSPDSSAALSGIGFAANRVVSLVLKKVRVYTDGGTVIEDPTPRVVYERD